MAEKPAPNSGEKKVKKKKTEKTLSETILDCWRAQTPAPPMCCREFRRWEEPRLGDQIFDLLERQEGQLREGARDEIRKWTQPQLKLARAGLEIIYGCPRPN